MSPQDPHPLKPAALETLLDVHFFRPAARPLAGIAVPTPLSAGAVTVISTLVGLSGASLLRFPSARLFVPGALLLVLHGVLGAVARQVEEARGEASALDRALAVGSFYLVGLATLVAVAVHMDAAGEGIVLAVVGLGSVLVQGAASEQLIARYIVRSRGQDTAARAYEDQLWPVAKAWAYLGASTHIALLSLFACVGGMGGYLWLRLVGGNAVLAWLAVEQLRRERRLEPEPPPPEVLDPPPPQAQPPATPPSTPPASDARSTAPISFRPPPLDE